MFLPVNLNLIILSSREYVFCVKDNFSKSNSLSKIFIFVNPNWSTLAVPFKLSPLNDVFISSGNKVISNS